MTAWTHFFIVAAIQIALFLFVARGRHTLRIAVWSVLLGIVVGIPFDLFFGKYLGIFSYDLSFGIPFLIANGALSYGAMIGTVWALFDKGMLPFYVSILSLGVIYETANSFFPVWEWTFLQNGLIEEIVVVGIAYFVLAILMALLIMLIPRKRPEPPQV